MSLFATGLIAASLLGLLTSWAVGQPSRTTTPASSVSFAAIDQRARVGEPLTVVFFGASLTWGANATDPQLTSYRGLMMQHLRERYPKCPFTFFDAAIGGPGSKLAMFRLERDVFARKPDLVFLDFTANDNVFGDDPATLASYETLLREIIGHGSAVVQMTFPFKHHLEGEFKPKSFKRYREHLQLSTKYGTGLGDAILLIHNRLEAGTTKLDQLWPVDPAHPDDAGYKLFFEAAKTGLDSAVADGRVCQVPADPGFAKQYATRQRIRLSENPPAGWTRGEPFRSAAFFDQQPSRWLDTVVIADAAKPPTEPIKLTFHGTFLGILGEGDLDGLPMRILIDGKVIPCPNPAKDQPKDLWPTNTHRFGGKLLIWREISDHLSPGEHQLEIWPVVSAGVTAGQLRIESICVAGPED